LKRPTFPPARRSKRLDPQEKTIAAERIQPSGDARARDRPHRGDRSGRELRPPGDAVERQRIGVEPALEVDRIASQKARKEVLNTELNHALEVADYDLIIAL
jgi:hypothetical protein